MFLLDSITRVAMAQREIGLSAGEPPATKGYPPSVFAMLPRLLERSGPGIDASITAFYTVLVEGDDIHDPIGDAVRGILDGHLWLSRDLAGRSIFPAVDPLQSISRSMTDVIRSEHEKDARRVIELISRYREIEDLIQIGAYSPGSDPRVDDAVRAMPTIEKFLKQERSEVSSFKKTVSQLKGCLTAANNGKRKMGMTPAPVGSGGAS
jgi:flagellum-specific ATP synthase